MYRSLFFDKNAGLRPATLLKKETLAQVFSCEFFETFKNIFFDRTPLMAASVNISVLKAKVASHYFEVIKVYLLAHSL